MIDMDEKEYKEFEVTIVKRVGALEALGYSVTFGVSADGKDLPTAYVEKGGKTVKATLGTDRALAEYFDEASGMITEIALEPKDYADAFTEEFFLRITSPMEVDFEDDEDGSERGYEKPRHFDEINLEESKFPIQDAVFNVLASYGLSSEDVYFYKAGKNANMVFDGSPLVPIFDYDFDDGRVPNGWGVNETDELIEAIDTIARKYGYSGFEQVTHTMGTFIK